MATSSIATASGVDALSLANTIISTSRTAVAHRRNCEQLAEHVKMVRNLLEKLKGTTEMEGVEEALRKGLELVESCREGSYLYTVAMGWSFVYRFREVEAEIDRSLRLLPLVSLAHEFRMQDIEEGLDAIEEDHRDYTLEEEEAEAQNVILKPDRTKQDAEILEISLLRGYPDMEFHEALEEEKLKLSIQLQRSRSINDSHQCHLIQHLIEVTENVVNVIISGKKVQKLLVNEPTYVVSGYINNAKATCGDHKVDGASQCEWQIDLFDCCREPCLSLKTCIYPCGTFSWIANVVSGGKTSREEAVSNLMAFSIFCGCCCYTCCIRRKLRKIFNIEGGLCDDFSTHLMCCCCALVQELRELEVRAFEGCQGRKMIPPPYQYMKP